MRHLTWWTTTRQTDEWGPDLAFIRLPAAAGFTRQLRASKSFYNLTLHPKNRMEEALDSSGFMAFVGYVAEQITDAPAESGFRDVRRIQGYAFLTGPEKYQDRNGFDYVDVGCDRLLAPTMPRSFGGVSGGGLWRFDVLRDPNEEPGQERLGKSFLAGVVFREDDVNTDTPRVRGHGARSIYEICLPQIRAWLRSSDTSAK
jgi:hypothetical protein